MTGFLTGVRHGIRLLGRAPAFSALAVTILAAGIGASTVMYTLVREVLLRDLPFADPDRLVWMYNTRTERDRAPISLPDLEDYRAGARSLARLAVFTNWTGNLTGAGEPERLEGVRVSGEFFPLLGTRASAGRLIESDDESAERRVAVISHALWQRRFGADPAAVGAQATLNGASYTIVGVLPPRFLFPFRAAEIAVPLSLKADPRRGDRGANFLRVVARLAPGVTLPQADAELDAIARRLQRLHPDEDSRKIGISLYPLQAEIVRDYRGMLWTLSASVAVLLAAGCVNLANLLLLRAHGRHVELAVRTSLGASRARLAWQLLGETSFLAALGGGAGMLLAWTGLAAWRALGPADFPLLPAVGLDPGVLAFAAGLSTLTAVVCGVVPAWIGSRDTADVGVGGRATAGRLQRAIERAFVATQLAMASVLLVGMLIMARGLARLQQVTPGFTPDRTLVLQISLPTATYGSRDALARFADAARERLGAVAGVEAAGAVSLPPLSGLLSATDVALPDRPAPPPDEVPQAQFRIATAGYFAAAGIPVLEGRAFDEHDTADGRPVAIVSRSLAARHWPGRSAIGHTLQIVQGAPGPHLTIVGVASDVKQFNLDGPATADLYVPLPQMPASQAPLVASRLSWIVRTRTAATAATTRAVRTAITQIDPGVAASGVRTLEDLWLASLGPRRANVRILEAFGYVAMVLCALGVYGVAALAGRMRRRELAIRAALGAARAELTRSVLRDELPPVLAGLIAGMTAAALAAPYLFGDAYQTSPRNVATYAEVALLLLGVAAGAMYIPVRRAGTTDPSEVLRA